MGGTGADAMSGGAGNDTYYVDDTGDSVTENPDEGTDGVVTSVSFALPDNVENLTLSGTDPINGTGNDLPNAIYGTVAPNTLTGNDGNDYLSSGGAGDDALYGPARAMTS